MAASTSHVPFVGSCLFKEKVAVPGLGTVTVPTPRPFKTVLYQLHARVHIYTSVSRFCDLGPERTPAHGPCLASMNPLRISLL